MTVIVAPEVARRILGRVEAGQLLGEICAAERVTPREVWAVLADFATAPPVPVDLPLAARLLRVIQDTQPTRP